MSTLFVIAGSKGVGKSTSANHIHNTLWAKGYLTEIVSFATPLKKMVDSLFHLGNKPFGTEEDKASYTDWRWGEINAECWDKAGVLGKSSGTPVSVRELLQLVGTMFRDNFCHTFWEKLLCNHVAFPCDKEVVIIDDCRLPQELLIDPVGYSKIVKVLIRRGTAATGDRHYTETALASVPLESFDAVIDNDGSKEALYEHLEKLLRDF
jgi:hypothetical protein